MSAAPARRAIVAGLDGASMELVQNMADAGHMPNVRALMKAGVWRPMVGVFPTLTPPGWTALSTGSWPGTHGVLDFNIRHVGERLDRTLWGIDTSLSRSEYIWNAFERGGKKPILVKWEMSWAAHGALGGAGGGHRPRRLQPSPGGRLSPLRGRQVGAPAARGPARPRDPGPERPAGGERVRSRDPGRGPRLERTACESSRPPKEAVLTIRPLARGREDMNRGREGTPLPLHALIYASGDRGYDRVRICRSKNAARPLTDLGVGEWSDWWLDRFEIDGRKVRGYVRAKLITLTPRADAFELFIPQIWPPGGYTKPASVAREIDRHVGNFLQNPARDALGLIDDDTYFELLEFHHERLAEVAGYLAGSRDWDLLMTETHASDYTSHFFLRAADPHSGAPPSVQRRCREGVERTYASIDRWIGRLRRLAGDDTAFFVVSDHGGTSQQHTVVNVAAVLEQAGFLKYQGRGRNRRIDWTRTRAAGRGPGAHLREPEGAGARRHRRSRGLRRRTCQEIIQALHDYKDPGDR